MMIGKPNGLGNTECIHNLFAILCPLLLFTLYFAVQITLISGTLAGVMTAGSMQDAPSLSQRNYYADEVRMVNPCLPSHLSRYGEPNGNMPDGGWGETLLKCENSSRLETLYGAVIERRVVAYTNDSAGRIDAVYHAGMEYMAVPSVVAAGADDLNYYAYGVASEVNAMLNGVEAVRQKGNCVSVLYPQLTNSTWNAIKLQHYAYGYTHVVRTSDGWCFQKP